MSDVQVAEGVQRCLVATWSEQGTVNVWDTSRHMVFLENPSLDADASAACLRGHCDNPLFSFSGHHVKYPVVRESCIFLFA